MISTRFPLAAVVLAAASLSGCCRLAQPIATPRAPAPCTGLADAPTVELPAARAPADLGNDKGQPYRFANAVPVNRGTTETGRWTSVGDWRVWQLSLFSPGARSLSVHLAPVSLGGGDLWLCGAEGTRLGPYRADSIATPGELWTPAVPGSRMWLELAVPEGNTGAVAVTVTKAFAAFR